MNEKEPKSKDGFWAEVTLLQPWSTFVMRTKLPPLIFKKMIKITDEIITNSKSMEKGQTGAGELEDEFLVEHEILEREDLLLFFLDLTRQFAIQQTLQANPLIREKILNDKWYTKMRDMWIISQKDNEYQPVHQHLNCHISCVMYLKIPEYLPNRNPTQNNDGAITFINNTTRDWTFSNPSSMRIQPKVGDIFVFAASLPHLVYPFRTPDGKGERRSVSFNAVFSSKKQQEYFEKEETKGK